MRWLLALALVAGCRAPKQQSARVLSETVADDCSGFAALTGPRKTIIEQLFRPAYPQLTPVEAVEKVGCAAAWERLRLFSQSVSIVTDDLAVVRDLTGFSKARLSVTITKMPANLDAILAFKPRELVITGAKTGVTLSAAERTNLVATVASFGFVEELALDNLGLVDLSALKTMPQLQYLRIRDNQVEDLGFLSEMEALRQLYADGNRIADLTPLTNLLSLVELSLARNRIESIEAFLTLANLELVTVSDNPKITNILALQYMPNVKFLMLARCGITDV